MFQAWRGYYGNVYFEPIIIRRSDNDAAKSPTATPSLSLTSRLSSAANSKVTSARSNGSWSAAVAPPSAGRMSARERLNMANNNYVITPVPNSSRSTPRSNYGTRTPRVYHMPRSAAFMTSRHSVDASSPGNGTIRTVRSAVSNTTHGSLLTADDLTDSLWHGVATPGRMGESRQGGARGSKVRKGVTVQRAKIKATNGRPTSALRQYLAVRGYTCQPPTSSRAPMPLPPHASPQLLYVGNSFTSRSIVPVPRSPPNSLH